MLVAERLCEKSNIFPLSTSVENGHTNFQQSSKQHHFQETGEEVDMG